MTTRSQPIWAFTLTATRVSQTAYTGPTLMTIPQGLLKDRNSPTMTARSQLIWVFTLTATRVSQTAYTGSTLMSTRKTAYTSPTLSAILDGVGHTIGRI